MNEKLKSSKLEKSKNTDTDNHLIFQGILVKNILVT